MTSHASYDRSYNWKRRCEQSVLVGNPGPVLPVAGGRHTQCVRCRAEMKEPVRAYAELPAGHREYPTVLLKPLRHP